MERHPRFLRDFSKQHAQEERDALARDIKARRAEQHARKGELQQNQQRLESSMTERAPGLHKKLKELQELRVEIAELSKDRKSQILNFLRLRKARADLAVGQHSYEELKQLQEQEAVQQGEADQGIEEEVPAELARARDMVDGFYRQQAERWEAADPDKEEMSELFSEEHLAKISLQDYELLLRRFPNHMVAHVTRQGIRDHIGSVFHNKGANEYSDGFMKMAQDGHLRSPLSVMLTELGKEQAVAKLIDLDKTPDKETAMSRLDHYLSLEHHIGQGSFEDRSAIHFAAEEVADNYYGSEQGNEIFLAYPSAHIASQYKFHGQLNEAGGGYWNDQWVWANEERGMDINAGVVFIPKDTRVDRRTGSRYELNAEKQPEINMELVARIKAVVEDEHFASEVRNIRKILGEINQPWTDEYMYGDKNRQAREKLEPYRKHLEDKLGITDVRAQRAILSYDFLGSLLYRKEQQQAGEDEERIKSVGSLIQGTLKEQGILFKEAQDNVPAEEFWENYFDQHPDNKPSKIVYYQEGSPTAALREWKRRAHLRKTTSDKSVGFDEHNTIKPFEKSDTDRFRTIATGVIEGYFEDKERAQAA